MRRLLPAIAATALMACDSTPPATATSTASDVQTIHTVAAVPAPLETPPLLQDEAPPPKPKALPWETPAPIVFSPEDEKLRSSLPFTPAIAMDPIDGSKISIRATTPTFEYKGKIYYFSSPANRSTFAASPDQYLKGRFTQL